MCRQSKLNGWLGLIYWGTNLSALITFLLCRLFQKLLISMKFNSSISEALLENYLILFQQVLIVKVDKSYRFFPRKLVLKFQIFFYTLDSVFSQIIQKVSCPREIKCLWITYLKQYQRSIRYYSILQWLLTEKWLLQSY